MESDAGDDCKRLGPFRAMLRRAGRALEAAGVAQPQRDARVLARWAADLDGPGLAVAEADPGFALTAAAAERFERGLAARLERRPMAHILGGRQFFGRWFAVDGRALDPRPESETLIEAALAAIGPDQPARLLDLGVGSGCLIVTLLAERPRATGLGVDASPAALDLASENARRHGVSDRLDLRSGDWLNGVAGRFDAILCNPPYIAEAEMAALDPEVRVWEPRMALTPGADGLAVHRRLAPLIGARLTPGGLALFEVGRGQADAAAALFAAAGPTVRTLTDLGGVARALRIGPPTVQSAASAPRSVEE